MTDKLGNNVIRKRVKPLEKGQKSFRKFARKIINSSELQKI